MKTLILALALCPFAAHAQTELATHTCVNASGKTVGEYTIAQLAEGEEPAGPRFVMSEKLSGIVHYTDSQEDAEFDAQDSCAARSGSFR